MSSVHHPLVIDSLLGEGRFARNVRWLSISEGDYLTRVERSLIELQLSDLRSKIVLGAQMRALGAARSPLHEPPTREQRLERANYALLLREKLRRHEEWQLRESWALDDERRWPDRSKLWVPLACTKCDFNYALARELDERAAGAPRAPDEEAMLARWSRCQGRVLFGRAPALWEATAARTLWALLVETPATLEQMGGAA